jgi:hypothetical protein
MRPQPDCLGHLDVSPPLNAAEATYLRTLRPPLDPDDRGSARGRPASGCCWTVCRDGCCLLLDEVTRTSEEVAWLRWIIGHLLKRGADAARSRNLRFDRFTFDHTVSGVVVGSRGRGELFAVTVRANRVSERLLTATPQARPGGRHGTRAVVIDLATRRSTRR